MAEREAARGGPAQRDQGGGQAARGAASHPRDHRHLWSDGDLERRRGRGKHGQAEPSPHPGVDGDRPRQEQAAGLHEQRDKGHERSQQPALGRLQAALRPPPRVLARLGQGYAGQLGVRDRRRRRRRQEEREGPMGRLRGPRPRGGRVQGRVLRGLCEEGRRSRPVAAGRGEPLRRRRRHWAVPLDVAALGLAARPWLQACRGAQLEDGPPRQALDPRSEQAAGPAGGRHARAAVQKYLRGSWNPHAAAALAERRLSDLCAVGLRRCRGVLEQRAVQGGAHRQPLHASGGERQRAHLLVPETKALGRAAAHGRRAHDLALAQAAALCGAAGPAARALAHALRGRGHAHVAGDRQGSQRAFHGVCRPRGRQRCGQRRRGQSPWCPCGRGSASARILGAAAPGLVARRGARRGAGGPRPRPRRGRPRHRRPAERLRAPRGLHSAGRAAESGRPTQRAGGL
mmetsp:Transcript_52412/g.140289  ORF Transcript_52412/g.140289 Transcript_52412/m.140289 type:complete len:458 (-) Transcript_52412:612-1985(-)